MVLSQYESALEVVALSRLNQMAISVKSLIADMLSSFHTKFRVAVLEKIMFA